MEQEIEDILRRPDTYIGSINSYRQKQWVYSNDSMVHRNASSVPGLFKIFNDILETVAEIKMRDTSLDSLKVVIDVEEKSISVSHNGEGVPIELEDNVYMPELIFGHLYNSRRNGYGLTLANIFSIEFKIEIAVGKRMYKQVFSNNMRSISQPDITTCNEGEKWTKVTFKPDLKLFNLSSLDEDIASLMKKRVVDLAGCFGKSVKVELNDHWIQLESFCDYADLCLYSIDKFTSKPLPRTYAKISERCEICVSLSDGEEFQQVSFVNSIATLKGGTHIEYVTNQITTYLMNKVNEMKMDANIKANNVKNHLWVFVNVLIDNPTFDSQAKEALTTEKNSFGSTFDVPESILEAVSNSGIMDTLRTWASGTKIQWKVDDIEGLKDALYAGKSISENCTLILTEGESAKNFAIEGRVAIGADKFYGVYRLTGKIPNVSEAKSKEEIFKNKNLQNIMNILGLQPNKVYKDEDIKSLRYGRLMIMADQDHDGSHIKGLLINFIYSFWPSLLKISSFIVEFISPIIKAFHSNEMKSFYSMPEFEQWRKKMGDSANCWTINYYKGLARFTAAEARGYFTDIVEHTNVFFWQDEQDGSAIKSAFSKSKEGVDKRKAWILNFEPGNYRNFREKRIRYKDFIEKELVLFFRASVHRSILSMLDGLKPSQRKILFSSFNKEILNQDANIGKFSSTVSQHTAYHHGEQNLYGTMIRMAQDFTGTNNINLLKPKGLFGGRNEGGKDHASARYIDFEVSPVARCLFPEDDDEFLEYLNEEGMAVEPKWFMPVLPMILVNGSKGIGTGWSSYVPNYRPRDIIANRRHLLNNEDLEPMDLWYRGFEGNVIAKEGGGGYEIQGKIEEGHDGQTLFIRELPLRSFTIQEYVQFLKTAKGTLIETYKDDSTNEKVDIMVRFKPDKNISKDDWLKELKLTRPISTNNMHLINAKGEIKKYDNPEQILREFYPERLNCYERKREHKLKKLEHRINNIQIELEQKVFTPMPRKGKAAEPTKDISEKLQNDDSTEENAKAARVGDYEDLVSMRDESVMKLLDEMDKKTKEYKILFQTTAVTMWTADLLQVEEELFKYGLL